MELEKIIPYYGKYNSINSINHKEEENVYLVRRYDNKGMIKKDVFSISSSKKNTELLKKDYYNDVGEYLAKYKEKYEIYKNKKLIVSKDIDKIFLTKARKVAKSLMVLATCLVGVSLYLTSIPLMIYIATVILISSSTGLLFLTDLDKELDIRDFIENYENFEIALKEYNIDLNNKDKKSPTFYNGLNNDKNKGNDLKMKKIKVMDKVA